MTGDFNIRDRDWDPEYLFHSFYSDILIDIANSFNLSLSNSTNHIATRYLDNNDTLNLVIDLMFLRSSSSELNYHSILLELQYSSDHTPLVVNLQIIKEFVPVIKYTIKKNSNEELAHTTDIINKFKKIDITFLTSKEALEDIVNKFVLTQEHLWLKHSKCVNIIK